MFPFILGGTVCTHECIESFGLQVRQAQTCAFVRTLNKPSYYYASRQLLDYPLKQFAGRHVFIGCLVVGHCCLMDFFLCGR